MRRGFTLLEILVAMTLLSIILATVYQSFDIHVKSMEHAQEVQREGRIVRLAFTMMARDIQSAFWEEETQEAPEGQEEEVQRESQRLFIVQSTQGEDRPWDRIAFLTLGPSWTPHQARAPWVHEVEYRLLKEEETERVVLVRREDPTPDGDLFTGGEAWILAEDIKGYEVQCLGDEGETSRTWDTREKGALPKSVLLRLWIGDPRKPEQEPVPYTLRVAIPTPAQEGS